MRYLTISIEEGKVANVRGSFAVSQARNGKVELVIKDQEPLEDHDLERIAKKILDKRASKNRVRKTNRLRA